MGRFSAADCGAFCGFASDGDAGLEEDVDVDATEFWLDVVGAPDCVFATETRMRWVRD